MPEPTETQNQQSPLPLNPALAGYPDTASLVNGYRASGEEAKRLRAEVEKRDQVIAQIALNGGAANQRTVPNRNPGTAWDQLTEFEYRK